MGLKKTYPLIKIERCCDLPNATFGRNADFVEFAFGGKERYNWVNLLFPRLRFLYFHQMRLYELRYCHVNKMIKIIHRHLF